MNWAKLSKASKAVLPVIACHCNERGDAFPGEEVLAALSGRTAKTVRQGIRGLDGFPGFDWEYYRTKRGKRGKRFRITPPPEREVGRVFFFRRCIFDGGIWSELTPAAQALYPVLRFFGYYDPYEDADLDELSDLQNQYANRKWELCSAKIDLLSEYAGIQRTTAYDAMANLQRNFLLEPHKTDTAEKAWKVFIVPQRYWKASYLNQKLKNEAVS